MRMKPSRFLFTRDHLPFSASGSPELEVSAEPIIRPRREPHETVRASASARSRPCAADTSSARGGPPGGLYGRPPTPGHRSMFRLWYRSHLRRLSPDESQRGRPHPGAAPAAPPVGVAYTLEPR